MSDSETLNRLARIEAEQATLKEKSSNFGYLIGRFESTLEKVEDLIENRRTDTNEDLKDIYYKISQLEDKITNSQKDLNIKIESLNKWRWFTQGAMFVIGVIIAKLVEWFTSS